MPENITLDLLPAPTLPLNGDEILPADQGVVTVRPTVTNLSDYVRSKLPPAASTIQWRRMGTVLEPTSGDDIQGNQEASVIYETVPRVLADIGTSVFKCWYTGGYSSPKICYAESYDGITWVRKETAGVTDGVLDGYWHSGVIKVPGTATYYLFGTTANTLRTDIYSSLNGLTWTLVLTGVLDVTTGETWEDTYLGNMFPIYENGTWILVYEALGTTAQWSIGIATATAIGGPWTKNVANPVLTSALGPTGGPFVKKIGTRYHMWVHQGVGAQTDIFKYHSDNLTTWTLSQTRPALGRGEKDGAASASGQVADPWLVELDGKTYMFYEGFPHGGNPTSVPRIKLAIADATIAELVTMDEAADLPEIETYGQTGVPVRVNGLFTGAFTTASNVTSILTVSEPYLRSTNGASLAENGWTTANTWNVQRTSWYNLKFSLAFPAGIAAGTLISLGFGRNTGVEKQSVFYIRDAADTPTFEAEFSDLLYRGDTIQFRLYVFGQTVTTVDNSTMAGWTIMEIGQ